MKFLHYLGAAEHCLTNLKNSRMKVARMSEFNDPFEGSWREPAARSLQAAIAWVRQRRRSPEFRERARLEFPHLKESELDSELERTEEAAAIGLLDESGVLFEQNQAEDETLRDQHLRVLCLCDLSIQRNHDILMWAHYGGKHRGVRLWLDFSRDSNATIDNLYEIDYRTARIELDTPFSGDPDSIRERQAKALKASILTKGSGWEYENEWRWLLAPEQCFVDESDSRRLEFTRFAPESVSRIDLGVRCPQEDRNSVLETVRGAFSHVEVYQARLHRTDYALEYHPVYTPPATANELK